MSWPWNRSRSGWARGELLQLGDELGVAAESQVGLAPVLERGDAQLLEPQRLAPQRAVVGEAVERRTAPERERVARSPSTAVAASPSSSAALPVDAARARTAGRRRRSASTASR